MSNDATEEVLTLAQYSLNQEEKAEFLLERLNRLSAHHFEACPEYGQIMTTLHGGPVIAASLDQVPYLPVGLFKTNRLSSVAGEDEYKVLTSSGTTGQQVSQIVLDRPTAQLQTRALSAIMRHILGDQRMPMLIIDTPNVVRDRARFSARAAGVLGMLNFGRKHFYALNDEMELDRDGLREFLAEHGGQPFLMFGFTFMVWQYLYAQLSDGEADLSNGVVVHSGGVNKLIDQAVDNPTFKARLAERTGLERVYNFYGMVEQVGSVFVEGEDGFLYTPNFADVIIRDPITWQEAAVGEVGVIEVLSALPESYPGHAILTEDLGVVHGVDDSTVGRAGKRFSVIGRVPKAELRGCSDVVATERSA